MFAKASLVSWALLVGLVVVWGVVFATVTPHDIQRMQTIVDAQKATKSSASLRQTRQYRKGVNKELWVSQEGGGRLHHRIDSDASVLTIVPVGSGFDLIEKLEGIRCWMQDKLIAPSLSEGAAQQLRFLRAQEGFYHTSSQEFLAQSVDVSLYKLPGQQLPVGQPKTAPFLKGVAKDIVFSLANNAEQFKAEHFKAEFTQEIR